MEQNLPYTVEEVEQDSDESVDSEEFCSEEDDNLSAEEDDNLSAERNADNVNILRYPEAMLDNGMLTFGPPLNWQLDRPPNTSELFIRNVPVDMHIDTLLAQFMRMGALYTLRLALDETMMNRGYAYVRFIDKLDMNAALEVFKYWQIEKQIKIEIKLSMKRKSLFIKGIPKHLMHTEVEYALRSVFNKISGCYIPQYPQPEYDQMENSNEKSKTYLNKGYAIVHFNTHREATKAKQRTSGKLILWHRNMYVFWAKTENTDESNRKTLFVRNIAYNVDESEILLMLSQFISLHKIHHVCKLHNYAFFEFTTHEAALDALERMQNIVMCNKKLEMEWANPSARDTEDHVHCRDFDAELRKYCMANKWQIPIVLFGTYFADTKQQYAAVILRDNSNNYCGIICIMHTYDLNDIHARLCEAVIVVLDRLGCFPQFNCVLSVQREMADFLGILEEKFGLVNFIAAANAPRYYAIEYTELYDLYCAIGAIVVNTEGVLLNAYRQSLRTLIDSPILYGWKIGKDRLIGAIQPTYRKQPSLPFNLNDTKIVLALIYEQSGMNYALRCRARKMMFLSEFPRLAANFTELNVLQLLEPKYIPRLCGAWLLDKVIFGIYDEFGMHPEIIWMPFCSYDIALKEVPSEYFIRENLRWIPAKSLPSVVESQIVSVCEGESTLQQNCC